MTTKHTCNIFVVLLLSLDCLHTADGANASPPGETDARLHTDGKGWRLDQATATAP